MRSSGTLSSLSSSQWPVLCSFNAPTLQYWRVYTNLEKMSVNRPVRRFWCCSWCCCGRIFIDSLVSWWWLWSDGAAPAGTRVLLLSLRWLVGGICRAGWHRVVVRFMGNVLERMHIQRCSYRTWTTTIRSSSSGIHSCQLARQFVDVLFWIFQLELIIPMPK